MPYSISFPLNLGWSCNLLRHRKYSVGYIVALLNLSLTGHDMFPFILTEPWASTQVQLPGRKARPIQIPVIIAITVHQLVSHIWMKVSWTLWNEATWVTPVDTMWIRKTTQVYWTQRMNVWWRLIPLGLELVWAVLLKFLEIADPWSSYETTN